MQTTQITKEWEIKKKPISIPTLSTSKFEYTGSAVAPSWESFSSTEIDVGGDTSAIQPGSYTATFTPKKNYCWPDGSTAQKSITWIIEAEKLSVPTQANALTYTGSAQSPTWNGYDTSKLTIGGTTSSTNAGTYTATFTPKAGCLWSDGTATPKSVEWTISKASITAVPSQAGSLTYSGAAQSPSWSNYSTTQLTIGGTTSGTNAGTYTATFTPKSNWCWSDGGTGAKSVSWTIGRLALTAVPAQNNYLEYTGSSQSPTWNNYDSTKLTIGGTTSSTNAGQFTATFTPKSNWCWSDGSTSAKSITWYLNQLMFQMPSQSGSLLYTGNSQSPTWNSNYDSTKMTVSGTTSAVNAGTYTVTFKLKDKTNYLWSNTYKSDDVSQYWTIGKASTTLTISPTSLEFTGTGTANKKTITATTLCDGAVTASSSNTSKATTSVSGKTITVTPVADGTATITVGVNDGTNYWGPSSKTASVSISSIYTGPSKTATAEQFQSVIQGGRGPSTFVVGDLVGIPINGNLPAVVSASNSTPVPVNLSGTYYSQILGFNHNIALEGTGNYVDLQFLTSADGATPLCFCPINGGYQMNTSDTNAGGPGASRMYTTTLPALLQLIDSTWRSTFVEATKYVDTNGNSSNIAANVNALKSKLFLLAEFEIFGVHVYANKYEENKQKQYDMYKNGAITVRKSHEDGISARYWWGSSPRYGHSTYFCGVTTAGVASIISASTVFGLAPGCRIG